MAATPFDISGPGSSFLFDIYNDGQPLQNPPILPSGPCNYTDQTLPRCGCRRFWGRPPPGGGFQNNFGPSISEICMCSHHACFHEDIQTATAPATVAMNVAGQENQKPRSNREPLSPVQDLGPFQMPSNLGSSLDLNLLNFQSQVGSHRTSPALPSGLDEVITRPESTMPDTLNSWGNLIQSRPNEDDGLPPIPSQCLLPASQPPSTASSSQSRYLRPFGGKGLNTLTGGGSALRNELSTRDDDESNREHVRESPLVNAPSRTERDATPTPAQSQRRPSAQISEEAWQKMSNTVDSHEQRIERLENASFSVAGHEECHDKHDHADLRVTELESRVEEVEKILNDSGSIASVRRTIRADASADDATASVVSVSTNATTSGPNRVEMYSQLQSLQAQVNQLQAASLPSYTKPWELEVVFLPFPLKGIWMEAHEFPSQRRSAGSNADEWTQMPNTISRSTPDPQSPKFQEWAGQSAGSNWLLPRAFVAGRVIDQRLKSRGLIKTVLVRGPDARSIQLAIHNAFGDVLRVSSSPAARSARGSTGPLAEFLGLRQAWVPLRKLHKDSRLRFLAPAEMATPALWDFTFLVSSVVMKATGIHRLYVTQPEAYLQDHPLGYHALESGWSWQKLRELSRVYPDSQSTEGDLTVPEADAMETCWAWDDRLDEAPSVHNSTLSLREGHQKRLSRGSSTSLSQQFFTGIESPILSSSQVFIRAKSPAVQRERQGSRPPQVRTNSLPPTAAPLLSPSQSRRRISMHASGSTPYERRSSPLVSRASPRPSIHSIPVAPIMATATAISKRRLGTRSPSVMPRNTPRWSRTSMSRSPSLVPMGVPFGFQEDRERRTTPFYYATPHSDAIPDYLYQRAGSRGPVVLQPSNGYEPDDDEDMEGGLEDEHGSSTDPYDSEMTNDENSQTGRQPAPNDSFGWGAGNDDGDIDVDVYEDEDDALDGTDTEGGNGPGRWNTFGQPHPDQGHSRPEDIPWAGIEDHMSDGENINPESDLHSQSQSQSQSQPIAIHEDADMEIIDRDDGDEVESGPDSQPPSEYSSKQNAWPTPAASESRQFAQQRTTAGGQASQGFQIHEDDSGPETQWA
ncbi:midasin [Echria macrotheca]|uniref:Midasin n=1 Tax=Echria macrotheca TaxID=438768 RepID=A0AAJ0FCS3_9PEZI|nr:midasin [Echria macrotheca]